MPPILGRLRQLEPGIEIELIASNSTSDLKRREADIAVRIFRPTQSDLIARKICDTGMRLYAASSYLRKIGNPTSPEEFGDADFLGIDRRNLLVETLNDRGFTLTLRNFPVITEHHLVGWELVKHGLGIGFMTEEVGDAEPMVERVLPRLDPFTVDVWLVAHRELKTSRRVRMVFDFLVSELS